MRESPKLATTSAVSSVHASPITSSSQSVNRCAITVAMECRRTRLRLNVAVMIETRGICMQANYRATKRIDSGTIARR